MTDRIDFSNQYKIRISNPDDSMRKHDVVKLLIVVEIMYRTRNKKKYHIIYTEYPVGSRKFDVYHKNLLTNEIIAYEIQDKITKAWKENLKKFIDQDEKNINIQVIDLKKLSNDIKILNKQVKEYIVV